jgi:hypothetical protein
MNFPCQAKLYLFLLFSYVLFRSRNMKIRAIWLDLQSRMGRFFEFSFPAFSFFIGRCTLFRAGMS